MRTISTLQAPSKGAIHFGDTDVIREPERLRQMLGYLPQDFGVYPRVSAYRMLDHMAVLKGIADARERRETVETLLKQTNLWAVRNKGLAGFSGGKQTVTFVTDKAPTHVAVDPYSIWVDRDDKDNVAEVVIN
jgi:ABC-type multidrug transport system ATPase subunit